MATTLTVDERLAILEKEMAELKQGLTQASIKPNWIDRVKGTFQGDPEFGEILRLGKEIRQAEKSDADDGDA